MPFIHSKVSITMNEVQKETIKNRLGQVIEVIPGKTENWLMVELEDECCLYFRGNQDGAAAYIEVKIFGKASEEAYEELTRQLCQLYEEELNIPQSRIYVKYEEVDHWGFNGSNF